MRPGLIAATVIALAPVSAVLLLTIGLYDAFSLLTRRSTTGTGPGPPPISAASTTMATPTMTCRSTWRLRRQRGQPTAAAARPGPQTDGTTAGTWNTPARRFSPPRRWR